MLIRERALAGIAVLLLSLFSGSPGVAAAQDQDASTYDYGMPDTLLPFWEAYWEAKQDGDREAMEKAVRGNRDKADECLEIILDDLSKKEIDFLHHEARTLAWTLDDVVRSERYITRVRLVLEMDMKDRARRYKARRAWWDAIDLETLAKEGRTHEAWEAAMQAYLGAFEEFNDLGDYEMAIMCLSRCEQIEKQRNRPWERAKVLAQVVALGEKLSYRESVVGEAQQALDGLMAQGIDPTKDKPEELAKADEELPTSGGRGLDSFAEDSTEERFEMKRNSPKKGITGVGLPSIWPAEQYQLWPKTYISDDGPDPFDYQRAVSLKPWGRQWTLTRSSMFEFGLDTSGDGEPNVTFSASASPSRIEVPAPDDDDDVIPLMVATLAERELMYGVETNYAPTQSGARLRFWLASSMDGKVLGTPWKMYDLNMDGVFGPLVENFDDLITYYTPDDHVSYWEPDGVLIGRSKKAIPLSSVMPIGDEFYRCTPATDGTSVEMRKMHLATGTVKVDIATGTSPDFLLAREVDGKLDGAVFDILPARKGGEVTLPAGTYQIILGALSSGKRTSLDMARIYTGTSEPFKINAGLTTELELGAPYTMTFQTRSSGKEVEVATRTIRIFGRGGEEYAMLFDASLQPDVAVRDESGRVVVKGDSLRLNGIEQWQNNTTDRDNVLWFPMEYSIEVPKGDTYSFKLLQKKHALLGGPLESDWIQ